LENGDKHMEEFGFDSGGEISRMIDGSHDE
jgi:hypothetical protein